MIRPALPIMHLAEPAARQKTTQTSVSGFDIAFVLTSALILAGGCFFALDMASAKSQGHDSATLKMVAETSTMLPSMLYMAGKYALLLLASILNSALIVVLVQSLRMLDRKVSRFSLGNFQAPQKAKNIRGKRAHLQSQRAEKRRETSSIRHSSPFLLSPIYR
jgi:hypothetical protein